MISVKHINHSIQGTPILRDVSFELEAGQVIALIGPNGAGKSTLFSLMARLQPLDDTANAKQLGSTKQSSITFGGHDICKTSTSTLAKTVSMLSQENHIQSRLRVKELLMFGRYPYHQGQPTATDEAHVQAVIEQFELQPLAERFLSDLSGGQKQRVLIAMVICQDTPYILLDEPLNNLDMYHASQLMRILTDLTRPKHGQQSKQQGKTVVIVLHDINQAAQFADTIVMMKSGEVVATGTPNEVLTRDNMLTLFGVDVAILEHNGRPVIVSNV